MAWALGDLELTSEHLPDLLQAFAVYESPELLQAIGFMGEGAASAVPVLVRQLAAKDLALRVGACNALANIGPKAEAALPALMSPFRDRELRACAIGALGRIGVTQPKAVVAVLAANLESVDDYIRRAAVRGLCRLARTIDEPLPVLLKATSHPDSYVRISAVSGLRVQRAQGSLMPERFSAVVIALDDEDPQVRRTAVGALSYFSPGPHAQDAIQAMEDALIDPDRGVRQQARETLDRVQQKP